MSDSMGKAVWQAAKDGNEAELRRLIERGGNVNWRNPAVRRRMCLAWAPASSPCFGRFRHRDNARPIRRRLPIASERHGARAAALACRRPAALPSLAHASSTYGARRPPARCSSLLILEIVSLQHGEFTALIISSVYGREGCVRLLLDSKAAVNATDVSLEPALLEPVPWDRGRVTSDGPGVLLQVDDVTALHRSASNGHLAVTKLLLEGGADPTLRNKAGNTALDCDRSWGRSEVVALLSEPRYAARMHTDCPALPSGCAEAPSWAHADHGFSAARRTNGGQSSWDEAERTQRTPHGATRRVANAHPQDFRTESARGPPTRRAGHHVVSID